MTWPKPQHTGAQFRICCQTRCTTGPPTRPLEWDTDPNPPAFFYTHRNIPSPRRRSGATRGSTGCVKKLRRKRRLRSCCETACAVSRVGPALRRGDGRGWGCGWDGERGCVSDRAGPPVFLYEELSRARAQHQAPSYRRRPVPTRGSTGCVKKLRRMHRLRSSCETTCAVSRVGPALRRGDGRGGGVGGMVKEGA